MSEDLSNYWTATLYFKDPTNGTYHRVPPVYIGPGQNGAVGGLTVYYTQFDLSRDNLKQQAIKAFPPVSPFGRDYTLDATSFRVLMPIA